VRIRLFAIQRELAKTRELTVRLPDGATVADAWDALVERHPVLASGRASVRFARNGTYVAPDEGLATGDEVAVIPPVSGGASSDAVDGAASGDAAAAGAGMGAVRTILELRPDPLPGSILEELGARLATPEDGAVVGFIGRTRVTPGTPAPGQEDEAARHSGERVDGLEYEALEPMALAILAEIADDVRARFGVERLAIVHRTGEVPLGEASVAIVAVAPHRDAAFLAARHAIDETKARAPIWKAERFASGHVWVGSPAETGLAADSSEPEGQ
jgi:molybdopterin converting factor subunit 1